MFSTNRIQNHNHLQVCTILSTGFIAEILTIKKFNVQLKTSRETILHTMYPKSNSRPASHLIVSMASSGPPVKFSTMNVISESNIKAFTNSRKEFNRHCYS